MNQINKKREGGVCRLSLILNLIFIVLFLGLCYYKRDSIANRLKNVFGYVYGQPTEKVLLTFNNEPFKDVLNDKISIYNTSETISVLFLGNSLTFCGVPEEEPDKTRRGLTSTRIENDYVHQVCKMIAEKKKVNVVFSAINVADFERGFSKLPFDKNQLENATVQNPDYVIFQIGENVSSDDIKNKTELFKERYCQMIENFKDSKRIVTLPFWPDKEKINCITEVAVKTDSIIVDISHLGSGIDSDNFASSQKEYKQPGVGAHPGDIGMRRIAECIYSVMN